MILVISMRYTYMAIFLNIYRKSLAVFRTGQCNVTEYRVSAIPCNEWKLKVCGDTDLVTIALPGATHTCHFLPPAPLLTLLSRASAPPRCGGRPCLPTGPGGDHPAPGTNFHAPAPHPTLGPGAPVHSAAAPHFPAQYQAPQMPLLPHLPVHMLKQMPLHLPLHKP